MRLFHADPQFCPCDLERLLTLVLKGNWPLCSKWHHVMKYFSTMRPKTKSENVMADVYLSIAVAGVNALVVMGVAFAFVLI